MVGSDIGRLEHFLKSRFGFKIPEGLEFNRMTQEKLDKWLDQYAKKRDTNIPVNKKIDDAMRSLGYLQ